MCSDDMTARETPWEVTDDVITKLRGWWRRVMTAGTNTTMTSALHLELVARCVTLKRLVSDADLRYICSSRDYTQ